MYRTPFHYLNIQIIPPGSPSLSLPTPRTSTIRIHLFAHPVPSQASAKSTNTTRCGTIRTALDILIRELSFELCLEGGEGADELCAGLFEGVGGGDGAVGLELDEEVGVERVGDFVAREEDLW